MRRTKLTICAAMLGLSLVACGAPANDASPTAVDANATQENATVEHATEANATKEATATSKPVSSTASAEEKFAGEWKLAKAESRGVTISGNFSSMFGSEAGMSISLGAGGAGSMAFDGNTPDVTWELTGDDSIVIKPIEGKSDDVVPTMAATYDKADDAIVVDLHTDDFEGTVTFSRDGTLKSMPDLDLGAATAITSADQVAGTWSICGVRMSGAVVRGDSAAVSQMMGGSYDPTLIVNADGTVVLNGGESDGARLVVDENGAAIDDGTFAMPVKMLGKNLVLDMTELMGGTTTYMLYERSA